MAYDYIVETGLIIPDTEDLENQIQQEFVRAFGTALKLDPQTPQGRLIAIFLTILSSLVRNNAKLANQINPNESGGIFLEIISALTGLDVPQSTYSDTFLVYTGEPGAVIPEGITVKAQVNDYIFISQQSATLDSSGHATVAAIASQSGPVPNTPGTLTQIVTGADGLNSVTNTAGGAIGVLGLSDIAVRRMRRERIALNGNRTCVAIRSAAAGVTGYKDLSFRENYESSTEIIDGVTMKPHSIYVCIAGGSDAEIAGIIARAKSDGGGYNNGPGQHVSVPVYDKSSKQTNIVLFDRPNYIDIIVRVTISKNTTVSNPELLIQQAILDYASDNINNEEGFGVGTPVSPFELAGAVNIEFPQIYIKKVELKRAVDVNYQNDTLPMQIWEMPRIQASSIIVVRV